MELKNTKSIVIAEKIQNFGHSKLCFWKKNMASWNRSTWRFCTLQCTEEQKSQMIALYDAMQVEEHNYHMDSSPNCYCLNRTYARCFQHFCICFTCGTLVEYPALLYPFFLFREFKLPEMDEYWWTAKARLEEVCARMEAKRAKLQLINKGIDKSTRRGERPLWHLVLELAGVPQGQGPEFLSNMKLRILQEKAFLDEFLGRISLILQDLSDIEFGPVKTTDKYRAQRKLNKFYHMVEWAVSQFCAIHPNKVVDREWTLNAYHSFEFSLTNPPNSHKVQDIQFCLDQFEDLGTPSA